MFKVKYGMPERASREILQTSGLGAVNPHSAILTTSCCYHIKEIKSKVKLSQSKCTEYHLLRVPIVMITPPRLGARVIYKTEASELYLRTVPLRASMSMLPFPNTPTTETN
jgi:hypothetical protein